MLPDVTAPVTCPTCGAGKSHDVRQLDTLVLLGRVFQCGAAVSVSLRGHVYPALTCPKAVDIIDQLRADNARLGDQYVLLAVAIQGAIEGLEQSLRGWQATPLDDLPMVGLLNLAPLRAAYDELVDVLEGAAPTAEAAPAEPVHGLADFELASAVGARTSCSSE